MRRVLAALLLVACSGKKEPPPKPAPASGSAVAVAADAAPTMIDAAPSGPLDLLHAYPASVEVSSHVMNKTIKPEHLVDKDFNTAWNSKTGELAGAWMNVTIAGATIDEVRLTVGHTGKGPNGEDYFTMNPRITKVTLLDGAETPLGTFPLDPEKRELQSIILPSPTTSRIKIKVEDVVMGTKANWKEVCVSELEVIGKPPPDVEAAQRKPVVYVYQPPAPPEPLFKHGKPAFWAEVCDKLTKPLQKEYDRRNRHSSGEFASEDAPPSCFTDPEVTIGGGPWKSVFRWKEMDNGAHGPGTCQLFVTTADGDFPIGDTRSCGPWDDENLALDTAVAEDVIPGGDLELVVTYFPQRSDVPLSMFICRMTTIPECTKSYDIVTDTYTVKPRFSKGTVIFDPISGKPPTEISGPVTLSFSK